MELYVEKRDQHSNQWELVTTIENSNYIIDPYEMRDYYIFGVLANVRNEYRVPYISEPKGSPDDASDALKIRLYNAFEYNDDCSYLTLKEVLAYPWHERANYFVDFLQILSGLTDDSEDVRIVFYFC